jgi:IclR family transcriptional regulator, KDG regulon repressor
MSEPKRSPAQVPVVQAVDHCLQLIEALARNESPRGVTELGAELGLAKSTVHKLLQTLLRRGYAVQDPASGRYRLGLKFLELGGVVQGGLSIRTVAHPHLHALMEATNETVQLGVLEGHEVVYADKIECARTIRMYSRVGRRSPLHCTALGKVLLAYQPDTTLQEIADSRLERHAPRTITSPRALRAELQEVREKGYAFDDEEFEEGLRCLAAPARDHTGTVVASLGIAGPAARFEPARRVELIKLLRDAAEAVSRDLGYTEVNPPSGRRRSGADREKT